MLFAQMKAIELLKIGAEILKLMSKFDLRRDDYRYVGMFEEYMQRRRSGEKVDAILYDLADRFNISESTLKRVVKRLGGEVKM